MCVRACNKRRLPFFVGCTQPHTAPKNHPTSLFSVREVFCTDGGGNGGGYARSSAETGARGGSIARRRIGRAKRGCRVLSMRHLQRYVRRPSHASVRPHVLSQVCVAVVDDTESNVSHMQIPQSHDAHVHEPPDSEIATAGVGTPVLVLRHPRRGRTHHRTRHFGMSKGGARVRGLPKGAPPQPIGPPQVAVSAHDPPMHQRRMRVPRCEEGAAGAHARRMRPPPVFEPRVRLPRIVRRHDRPRSQYLYISPP